MHGPLTRRSDGVTVTVRLTPNARANALLGFRPGPNGDPVLRASVTAVPEKGKANAALLALLAKAWSLPKTSLTVISGKTDRNKVVHITGDPNLLADRLTASLSQEPDR